MAIPNYYRIQCGNIYLGEPSLKKNGKIWEKFPKGGGVKKNLRKFPISIWEFEKPRGRGLNFSKMSEFQLFILKSFYIIKISLFAKTWTEKYPILAKWQAFLCDTKFLT